MGGNESSIAKEYFKDLNAEFIYLQKLELYF